MRMKSSRVGLVPYKIGSREIPLPFHLCGHSEVMILNQEEDFHQKLAVQAP